MESENSNLPCVSLYMPAGRSKEPSFQPPTIQGNCYSESVQWVSVLDQIESPCYWKMPVRIPERSAPTSTRTVTRRDFAKGAAIAAAVATVPLSACHSTCGEKNPEAEAIFHAILRQHPKQFSEDQKKELRAQIDSTVEGLQKLRAYPLENWDEPAAVLHLPAASAPANALANAQAKGGRCC